MPTFYPPKFSASGGITSGGTPPAYDGVGTRARALVPTTPATDPGMGIYDAQTELLRRKKALLGLSDPSNPLRSANNAAGRSLMALSDPSNPLRAASNQGKRMLLDATGRYSGQQRGYYGTVGSQINERTAETNRLIDASRDVADLTAVAQAKTHRNAINALRDSVGIARPVEIDTPSGDTTPLPVGVARSLRSNAEYINETNRNNEAVRGNTLSALKNGLDISQLDVGDVRRAGDYADLNLGEATQGASYFDKLTGLELRDALDAGEFERDLASSDLTDASRAPYGKVLYEDPNGGPSRYVTPAEKDELDYAYRNSLETARLPTEFAQGQAKTNYAASQHPWGGLSEKDIGQIIAPQVYGFVPPATLEQLVAYYVSKGLPAAQAQEKAWNLIVNVRSGNWDEIERASKAADRGGPQLEVGPDGKLRVKP